MISGPGGTLYGPNAVNGVINIATRDARDTIGGLVRGTLGSNEHTLGARYGFALGANGALRFYGNCVRPRGPAATASGPTSTTAIPATGRLPRRFRARREHADAAGRPVRQRVRRRCPATATAAAMSLARWRRELDDRSSLHVQAYYDHFGAASSSPPIRCRDARFRGAVQPLPGRARDRRRRRRPHDPRRVHQQCQRLRARPDQPPAVDPERLRPGPDRADARAFADRWG